MTELKTNGLRLITLLSLILFTGSSGAAGTADLPGAIADIIETEQLAGIVWSTVSGETTQSGSAGFSNVALGQRMAQTQKVHVGSVTKTVLATGVLHLVTRGQLSLDTNVETLLPQLLFRNRWSAVNPVTVRHLLDHTAGLDNIRMWQFFDTRVTADTPLQNAFPVSDSSLLRIRTRPGTQYSYSNMGYALLGMVIEATTGLRYEDYLDDHLLAPLGMINSTFHHVSQIGPYADEDLAMGYFENSVPQTAIAGFLRPAGQFTTTASDMARLSRFLLGDGKLAGRPFIDPALMRDLGVAAGTDAARSGLSIGHGLAFALRDRHQAVGLCHPGTTIGFRAYFCLFPQQGKSFFYAINTDSETANYEQINALFIRTLQLDTAPTAKKNTQTFDLSASTGIYIPWPNNMAQFEWIDRVFNVIHLSRAGDHLVLRSLQSSDKKLLPLDSVLLRAQDRSRASHAIFETSDGMLLSDGLSTYKRESLLVMLCYWLSLAMGLAGLAYVVLVGLFRLVRRQIGQSTPLFIPFISIVGFAIPACFYYQQPFLKFGEMTAASLSLAIVTGLLPLSLLLAIGLTVRGRLIGAARRDVLAFIMLFQWCAVLFYWDLLPTVFWG